MEFEDALMLEKKLVLSGSRITLMNTRWAIISAKFLSTVSSQKYWAEVYAAGKDGGYETAIQIKKEQQMDPKKLVDFFISAWSEFGWGIAKLESSFANEFILSRFVDTKGKKIEAIGERWVLIPTSILSALHSRLPEEELFHTGEKVAEEVSANIKKRLGLNNNYLLAKFAEKGMSAGGWGKLTVEDFDEKNMRGIVSCEDPPAGGHLMRGMMAGFSKTITGREMDVREVECAETSCKKIKFYVTLKEPAASPRH